MQPDDRYLILRIDDERLELADGNIATALALPRDEAGERLERAWAEAPLAVMTALAWGPVAERLRVRAGVRAGVGFEGLLDLVLRGEIAVLDQRRAPLGARGPLPPPPGTSRRPSGTTPQADDALVNPVIGIGSVLLLVRKRYLDERKQPRDPFRLSTDSDFDGEGRFTCTSPALLFFRDAVGGPPLDLAQTRLAGADLTAGVILHAEARSPSAAMEDIELRLHLVGGSKARGPDDVVAVTAVELTLDIFSDALPAGERPLAGSRMASLLRPHADPATEQIDLVARRERGAVVLGLPATVHVADHPPRAIAHLLAGDLAHPIAIHARLDVIPEVVPGVVVPAARRIGAAPLPIRIRLARIDRMPRPFSSLPATSGPGLRAGPARRRTRSVRVVIRCWIPSGAACDSNDEQQDRCSQPFASCPSR